MTPRARSAIARAADRVARGLCPLCDARHTVTPEDARGVDAVDAMLNAHFRAARASSASRTAAPFVLPVGPVRKGHPLRDRGVRFVGGVSS